MDLFPIWMLMATLFVVLYFVMKQMNADCSCPQINDSVNRKLDEIKMSITALSLRSQAPVQSGFFQKEPQNKKIGRPFGSKNKTKVKS